MFAGGCPGDDLVSVLRVRGHEHDRVDVGVVQRVLVAIRQLKRVFVAEVLHVRRREIDGAGEPNLVGFLGRGHMVLSPPAEADNCCIDHEIPLFLLPPRRVASGDGFAFSGPD